MAVCGTAGASAYVLPATGRFRVLVPPGGPLGFAVFAERHAAFDGVAIHFACEGVGKARAFITVRCAELDFVAGDRAP